MGVVVDYIGEVGHGFSAFVHGGCEGRVCGGGVGGGVDGVNGGLPAVALFVSKRVMARRCWGMWSAGRILGQILGHPVRVLLDRFSHYDDFVAGRAAEGRDVLHGTMLEGVFPCVGDVGGDAVLVPDVLELYFHDEEEDD